MGEEVAANVLHGGRGHDEGVLAENDVREMFGSYRLCISSVPGCATRFARGKIDRLRSQLPALGLDVAVEVVVLGLAEMALVVNA